MDFYLTISISSCKFQEVMVLHLLLVALSIHIIFFPNIDKVCSLSVYLISYCLFYFIEVKNILLLLVRSMLTIWRYSMEYANHLESPGYKAIVSWSYGSWIYHYLCNQCLSPLKLWVRTLFMVRCTRYNFIWLATGRWFSPGTPPMKLTATI
jgi:hypothetical protein